MKQTVEIDVPEGMEVDKGFLLGMDGKSMTIIFKKKKVKDWQWYVDEYFTIHAPRILNNAPLFIEFRNNINESGLNCWDVIPFELKIGLLKFICDDLNEDWRTFIYHYPDHIIAKMILTEKLCPKEFLESIIK